MGPCSGMPSSKGSTAALKGFPWPLRHSSSDKVMTTPGWVTQTPIYLHTHTKPLLSGQLGFILLPPPPQYPQPFPFVNVLHIRTGNCVFLVGPTFLVSWIDEQMPHKQADNCCSISPLSMWPISPCLTSKPEFRWALGFGSYSLAGIGASQSVSLEVRNGKHWRK